MDSSSPPSGQVSDAFRPRSIPYMRAWFYGYVLALAAAVGLFISGTAPSPYHWLIAYVAYLSLACNALPLPTWWIVLLVGREFHPLLATVLGALGTTVANLNDYHFFYFWFRYERVDALRRRPLPARFLRWFEKSPFLMVSAAAFLPLPWDVIRMLAIASGYPRPRFAAANFVGRFARYGLLAWAAHAFELSNLQIIIFQCVIAALAITRAAADWRKTGNRPKEEPCGAESHHE